MNDSTYPFRGRRLLACLLLLSLLHLNAGVYATSGAPQTSEYDLTPEHDLAKTRLSPDLNQISTGAGQQTVRVIAQSQKGQLAVLRDEIVKQGGSPLANLELIDALVAEIPAMALRAVADAPAALYISRDSETFASLAETNSSQIHLLAATGASQVIGADGLANNRAPVVGQAGYIARSGPIT